MDTSEILLSIVVPVYNLETYIQQCLESLCHQGFEMDEYEIICIDDGSDDNTADAITKMMNRFPEIRMIRQENNQGVSLARNMGIETARGRYLFFCDGDDYLEWGMLKRIVDIMIEYSALSASFNYDVINWSAQPCALHCVGGGQRLNIEEE